MTRPRGVKVAAFPSGTGYGDAAAQHMAALVSQGIPVDFVPMVTGSRSWGPEYGTAPLPTGKALPHDPMGALVHSGVDYDTLLVSLPPPWIERWLDEEVDVRRVVYMAWETDLLPDARVAVLNHADRVLAPCRHNAETYERSGVRRAITVVPHVAREITTPPPHPATDLAGRYCFYVIGGWSARKGIEETIRAFLDAFTRDDEVALLVKTGAIDHIDEAERADDSGDHHPHHGTAWWSLARILREYPKAPPVHLITSQLDLAGMDAIHTAGDCFVSLSKGEGWGLGAFDAGLHGLPVILSRWGGPDDYLPADWPLALDHTLVPTGADRLDDWTRPDPSERWARPDPAHAIELLRWVNDNRSEASTLGAELGSNLRTRYAREIIGTQLVDALS